MAADGSTLILPLSSYSMTRFPIQETIFLDHHRRIGLQQFDPSGQDTAEIVHFMPLLFIVLAISTLADQSQHKGARQDAAENLHEASRRATAVSDTVSQGNASLWLVVGDILVARYLVLSRRASDAYVSVGTAVRKAQAIGLHRTTTFVRGINEEVAEERRRVWACE